MRLRDLTNGDLTYRELGSYVRGLPPDSSTRTSMNEGVPEPSGEQVMLADLFDAVAILDWHFTSANVDEKKPKPKKPKPYPRWWKQQPARRQTPQRIAKIEDARRRKRERERAIAEGRIA